MTVAYSKDRENQALDLIRNQPGITQDELAEGLGLPAFISNGIGGQRRSLTVRAIIQNLEKQGLITSHRPSRSTYKNLPLVLNPVSQTKEQEAA